ncbi:MAG: thiamine phosphate synthase [Alphaproteobacteria bacterium]|jgi:thiamine-phosphate pyrophosphorylase|nr:thiamine phosphate synthase [Alphaproteobacteria bacterium]HJP21857.1 thiamine phosphate synthase [Alphaproteobacteria bacterium]
MNGSGRRRCRLYLITPPTLVAGFAADLAAALAAGDVACLQLRLKDQDDAAVLAAAAELMPICHDHDVALILNDRPDLAAKAGADGVHVGQEDADYDTARALMGSERTVGITAHDSRHLAIEGADKGADYVAFGAFFATTTKVAKSRAEPELLTWWQETTAVPCIAIGGITAQNCGQLVTAGADFLAVVGAVWNHPQGPAAAVREFNTAIDGATGPL